MNVVIADDEELFRVGIAHILTRDEKINIVFQATNGLELLDYLSTCEALPDIVIMDIKMPELNGVEATKIINNEYGEVKIIALTTYNTKPFIRNMIDVGASAYLVKNSTPEKVLYTVNQVHLKGFYYDKHILKIINQRSILSDDSSKKTFFDTNFLTPRELEVLDLICQQYTNSEIGNKLFISVRTVEIHRKNLLQKTKVKNSAGLVIFALTNGLTKSML